MFSVLRHRVFQRLFAAHVVALLGTGLSTLAIGFLVFDVAGDGAASALGTLLAIKMLTFLVIGPLAPAIASRVGAKRLLVATDILRASIALALPFIDSIAAAYVLIFLLQSAAALFTPTFQATIPRVVTDERQYTGALALSRLAYDLETLASPTIAAAILLIAPSSALFLGTGAGFLASAALILSVALPKVAPDTGQPRRREVTRGSRLLLGVPRLRGTLLLHLSLALVGSIIMVLTVPLVRGELGGDETQAAALLACFGVGSIASAICMPAFVARWGVRRYMLGGMLAMTAALALVWPILTLYSGVTALPWLWAVWAVSGVGNSAVLAPMGRVIRDTVSEADLPHVFAAQFSLAHGWWLLSYPIAGWGAAAIGFGPITLILAIAALAVLAGATRSWRPERRRAGAAATDPHATADPADQPTRGADAAGWTATRGSDEPAA